MKDTNAGYQSVLSKGRIGGIAWMCRFVAVSMSSEAGVLSHDWERKLILQLNPNSIFFSVHC